MSVSSRAQRRERGRSDGCPAVHSGRRNRHHGRASCIRSSVGSLLRSPAWQPWETPLARLLLCADGGAAARRQRGRERCGGGQGGVPEPGATRVSIVSTRAWASSGSTAPLHIPPRPLPHPLQQPRTESTCPHSSQQSPHQPNLLPASHCPGQLQQPTPIPAAKTRSSRDHPAPAGWHPNPPKSTFDAPPSPTPSSLPPCTGSGRGL